MAVANFSHKRGFADTIGDVFQLSSEQIDKHASVVKFHKIGAVATVSTCSGTGEGAEAARIRTGAIAEAMEGAAVGQAVARLSDLQPRCEAGFAELRVISNTTGDRSSQRWDLKGALAVLSDLVAELPGALDATVRKLS